MVLILILAYLLRFIVLSSILVVILMGIGSFSLSLVSLCFFGMVLLGFRYLAASIPLISLAGVAVGVGLIFALLIFSISRNPLLSNNLIR
jgi:hypothetical protein